MPSVSKKRVTAPRPSWSGVGGWWGCPPRRCATRCRRRPRSPGRGRAGAVEWAPSMGAAYLVLGSTAPQAPEWSDSTRRRAPGPATLGASQSRAEGPPCTSSPLMRSIVTCIVFARRPGVASAQAPPAAGHAPAALDFATFATRVQPLFLAKRDGPDDVHHLPRRQGRHAAAAGAAARRCHHLERGGGAQELPVGVVAGRARVADHQPAAPAPARARRRRRRVPRRRQALAVADRSEWQILAAWVRGGRADADGRGHAGRAPRCGSSRPMPPATARISSIRRPTW